MKLKEKLAEEYMISMWLEGPEGAKVRPSFIAGFEKAREMIAQNLYEGPERRTEVAKLCEKAAILEMGEEKVEE